MALDHGYAPGVPPVNSDGVGDAAGEGQVRVRYNANGAMVKQIYLRNFSATGTVVGNPYVYTVKGTPGSGQVAIDPAGVATVNREIVFANEVVGINQWGWFNYAGVATVAVSGFPTVAVGDWLKLSAVGLTTGLVSDSASARSNSSVAMARAAQATNGVAQVEVLLLGDRAVLNG
jgi:hypothetical protein